MNKREALRKQLDSQFYQGNVVSIKNAVFNDAYRMISL